MAIAKKALADGTFEATGAGDSVVLEGWFNASLSGFGTATVELQKSYDQGSTWNTVSKNADGDDASYTADVELQGYEPEANVLYRWNCTAYTSGTIAHRLSQ